MKDQTPPLEDIDVERPTTRCTKCGYDLRAQSAADLCPECAYPVADSIGAQLAAPIDRVFGAMRWLAVSSVLGVFPIYLLYAWARYGLVLDHLYSWRIVGLSIQIFQLVAALDFSSGLTRILAAWILLGAVPGPRRWISVVSKTLLLLAAGAGAALMIPIVFPSLLSRDWRAPGYVFIALVPHVVWLVLTVTWWRLAAAIKPEYWLLRRANYIAVIALLLLTLSSIASLLVPFVAWSWWAANVPNSIWSGRFPDWGDNGLIERSIGIVLLLAILLWVRAAKGTRHPPKSN